MERVKVLCNSQGLLCISTSKWVLSTISTLLNHWNPKNSNASSRGGLVLQSIILSNSVDWTLCKWWIKYRFGRYDGENSD